MKHRIVPVKNVGRLAEAGTALINRAPGMPGMGLVYGATGYGKTTAITWFVNQCHGVYVRALAAWSPAAMLRAILRELDTDAVRPSCAGMVEQIIEKLAISNRPLFIDEVDYIVEDRKMSETLRDLHDLASVPVILIGMAGIQRKIVNRQQLTGRLAQWVEFKPCDFEDIRAVAQELCEVEIREDLLRKMHKQTGGSIRLAVVGLARIEGFAKARGLASIGGEEWPGNGGNGEFFIGEAPKAGQATSKPSKLRVMEGAA